jgi:hypothetical protein
MKKLLLILMGTTVLLGATQAQIQLGVKGGVSSSKFVASDIPTHAYIGYHVGALANIKVNGNFSIQPEAFYSSEGFKAHAQGNDNIRMKDHLGYVNVPVLARYTTNGFYVATGPQVGFLLNSNGEVYPTSLVDANGNVIADNSHTTFSSTSNHNKVVASWALGAGYQTPFKLGFDVRYNLGLSKIYSAGADVPTNTSVRNNVAQAGVFYILGK